MAEPYTTIDNSDQSDSLPSGNDNGENGSSAGKYNDAIIPEPTARKRGRPAGSAGSNSTAGGASSGNSGKGKKSLDRQALKSGILFTHGSIALMLHDKDTVLANKFIIDDKEAERLADAIVLLAAEYDIKTDPKTAAWLNLIGTAAIIYAPAVMHVLSKKIVRIE